MASFQIYFLIDSINMSHFAIREQTNGISQIATMTHKKTCSLLAVILCIGDTTVD